MTSTPTDLRTDYRVEPLGLDSTRPELAWRPGDGAEPQTAFQVQVATEPDFSPAATVWDSGRTAGADPFGIRYDGAPLTSGRRYHWRVRVWATAADPSGWSATGGFETGVLDPARWRAQWVSGPAPTGKADRTVVYLRSTLDLPAPVVRGRAHVSALGWYRFLVNGTDLTGPALVPRWTPYDEMVEYQTYDVTDVFRNGANVIALAVGDGRFRGRNGLLNHAAIYGDRLAGFAQVELDLADGSTLTVVTGPDWLAGPGRIVSADPKLGERVDLRVRDDDWLTAIDPPARFAPVEVLDRPRTLVAEEVGRVQEVARLAAVSVTRTPSGTQLVDVGQNIAGVVRIRLSGPAGSRVRLTHSELTRPDGELDVDYIHLLPIDRWYQRDEVVLDGGSAWYQPWFTIHGFRYVEVDGLADDLDPADVEAVVLSSDLPAAGSFTCSDPRLDRLHANVAWSLRSNFVDTPTDCPTRERSGWTGDIQVFGPTATTLVDAQAYLRRYLRNVAVEQLPDGTVPVLIPSESSAFSGGLKRLWRITATSVGWGDVTVLLPWTLYRYYGDRAVLERLYPTMTAWVDQLARRAHDKRSIVRRLRGTGDRDVERSILDTGYHWGEWLRPGEGLVSSAVDSQLRSRAVVATAYLEHSARILATIADLLGHRADATRYAALADRTRGAWRTAFLRPDGRIGLDRQDDYVRAIAFELLDPHERPAALQRLVELVERAGDHLGTGFLSTPLLLQVLVDGGRADVAWRLLMQTSRPSWLYQVEHGASTVWETWEGYREDGRATASHNHYAFGAVAGFLTEHVAGISPAEPGYRVIDVRPLVGGGLTSAAGSVQTPFGPVSSRWRLADGVVTSTVTVPPGASARVRTGDAGVEEVGAGTHTFSWPVPRG